MDPKDEHRPLVGEHPYVGAAREHRHPSPTGNPQTIGDLDRLQLAEQALADALAAAVGRIEQSHDGRLATMIAKHRAHVPELVRLIRTLGGAASERGPIEIPQPAEEIGRLILPDAIAAGLAEDARAVVKLYREAVDRLPEDGAMYGTLAGFLTAAQLDAERLGGAAGR